MTTGPLPLCYSCARARELGNKWTCEAYSQRIPFEIIAWLHDHRKPFDGDNGLQYVPKEEEFDTDDEGHEGRWVTMRGRKVFIREGEGAKEALDRGLNRGQSDKWPEAERAALAREVEKEFGLEKGQMFIEEGDGPEVEVGGKSMRQTGVFEPSKEGRGQAMVWTDALGKEEVRWIAAHEAQHARFNAVMNGPRVAEFVQAWKANAEELHKSGPMVSDYSYRWWKAVKEKKADEFVAVNETLSELAKVKFQLHGTYPKAATQAWRDLYELSERLYKGERK